MSKKNNQNFNIIPGIKMGLITPDHLERIAAVTRKHKIPLIKITSAQRLAFLGMDEAVRDEVMHELGAPSQAPVGKGIHYVQSCPGIDSCKYGQKDSIALGSTLEKAMSTIKLPAKTKIGISGCSMNCTESYIRDLGIFAKKKGWTLVFGGNGGGHPRIGDVIAEDLTDSEVIDLAHRCLKYYAQHAKPKERTARFMERTSLDDFKASVS